MHTIPGGNTNESEASSDDRPSFARVERFLDRIDQGRQSARRARWVGLAVGALIGGVALLTAIGLVSVAAENIVLSASAVAAGFALGKGGESATPDPEDRTDQL